MRRLALMGSQIPGHHVYPGGKEYEGQALKKELERYPHSLLRVLCTFRPGPTWTWILTTGQNSPTFGNDFSAPLSFDTRQCSHSRIFDLASRCHVLWCWGYLDVTHSGHVDFLNLQAPPSMSFHGSSVSDVRAFEQSAGANQIGMPNYQEHSRCCER